MRHPVFIILASVATLGSTADATGRDDPMQGRNGLVGQCASDRGPRLEFRFLFEDQRVPRSVTIIETSNSTHPGRATQFDSVEVKLLPALPSVDGSPRDPDEQVFWIVSETKLDETDLGLTLIGTSKAHKISTTLRFVLNENDRSSDGHCDGVVYKSGISGQQA